MAAPILDGTARARARTRVSGDHTDRKDICLDRERIECGFGLGGGELHQADERWPDDWDGIFVNWYDGAPEYAEDLRDAHLVECAACNGTGTDNDQGDCERCYGRGLEDREVRTVILDVLFGFPEPPPGWERIASLRSSGETECGWCGDGCGNEDQRESCDLCEGDGLGYLGDGMAEVASRWTLTDSFGC